MHGGIVYNMMVKCWGARGSLPVSGREFIRYGGSTTAMEVRSSKGDILLIDAGTGIRRLGNKLLERHEHTFNMLFTHAHWDHIMGFPFLKPIYFEKTNINIYGSPCAQDTIRNIVAHTMEAPFFPVNFHDINGTINFHAECYTDFQIGSLKITSIPLSHPNGGFGYRIEENGKVFVFLTDNELSHKHPNSQSYNDYVDFAKDADYLIHDSEYRPEEYRLVKGWGHSVFTDSLQLAIDAGVKRFGLNHHNVDRTDEGVDRIIDDCRKIATEQKSDLDFFALTDETEILL